MDSARKTSITTEQLRQRLGLSTAAAPRKPGSAPPSGLDNVVPIRPDMDAPSLAPIELVTPAVPEFTLPTAAAATAPAALTGGVEEASDAVDADGSAQVAAAVTTVSSKAVEAVLFELLHMVRAANAQRDDAVLRLREVASENRRLLAERQQLTCLTSRWESHAHEIERWADEMQRYYESRVDGCEQLLVRTVHEKERAFEIADELAAAGLWTRRFRRRTLADELAAIRGDAQEQPVIPGG